MRIGLREKAETTNCREVRFRPRLLPLKLCRQNTDSPPGFFLGVQKFLIENSDRVAQPTRGVARKHPPRARTPGPPPKVDLNKAARSLRELFTTESSYLRKIKALYRVGPSHRFFSLL